jgi:hypothetical protein
MKPKAYKAKNGKHYIEKRIASRVGAEDILEVLLRDADHTRSGCLESAAYDKIVDFYFDYGLDVYSDLHRIDEFRIRLEKAFDKCLDLFPDIPIEEFIEARSESFTNHTSRNYETNEVEE